MYWLQRPPILRWAAAAIVVSVALYADLRPDPTVLHPFATTALAPGDVVDANAVNYRPVPAGLLTPVDPTGRAVHAIAAGEPLLASTVGVESPVPDDWWAIPLQMPSPVAAGSDVLVVITEPVETIPGIVVAGAPTDPLSFEPTALVAVPAEAATRVALAATARTAVVLVAP